MSGATQQNEAPDSRNQHRNAENVNAIVSKCTLTDTDAIALSEDVEGHQEVPFEPLKVSESATMRVDGQRTTQSLLHATPSTNKRGRAFEKGNNVAAEAKFKRTRLKKMNQIAFIRSSQTNIASKLRRESEEFPRRNKRSCQKT